MLSSSGISELHLMQSGTTLNSIRKIAIAN